MRRGGIVAVFDGGSLVWRCAYGAHAARRSAGEVVLESILASCRLNGASRAVVCMDDKDGRRERRKLFPAYKEKRAGKELEEGVREEAEDVYLRLPGVLSAAGIPTLTPDGWEADDAAATAATALAARGFRVAVISGDKDMFQLVRPGVSFVRPRRAGGADVATPLNWQDLTGVAPVPTPREAWLAFQAVRGDPGDGVPGVQGVGEVTAREALAAYPDLLSRLGRPARLGDLKPKALKLLGSAEALLAASLSYELVRLRDDLPMRCEPPPRGGPGEAALGRALGKARWEADAEALLGLTPGDSYLSCGDDGMWPCA